MRQHGDEPVSDLVAARCELTNPVFSIFGPVVFRRAEADGTPAMVVPLGERLAVLPLRALKREFGITDESPDGQMLGLIAASLDYVAGLRPGDRLPPEVLTGEASWSPEPRHCAIAAARLRRHLFAAFGVPAEAALPEHLERDPARRAAVQSVFERAAAALGLAGRQDVLDLLERLAEEAAYIEALRETLLLRVQALCRQAGALGIDWHGNGERHATLTQVRRLTGIARDRLGARFAAIDAEMADALAALRNLDARRASLRAHRDWLHRTRRAFEPVLTEWEAAPPFLDDTAWPRLGRTYQFLAPRFMPVQEWECVTAPRPSDGPRSFGPVMQW
jgi:hypothetical protein